MEGEVEDVYSQLCCKVSPSLWNNLQKFFSKYFPWHSQQTDVEHRLAIIL